jgi:signal transduction histidine kinase
VAREALLTEDQERIAADLHNRVIEYLFEAGMGIQSVMRLADGPLRTRLEDTVDRLDLAIREIRNTVFGQPGHADASSPETRVMGPSALTERGHK